MTRWLNSGLLVAFAGTLLVACAPLSVRRPATVTQLAAQAEREALLGARDSWNLDARFAASDGQHGGSGSLDWQQRGEMFRLVLRAPITGKTVQLDGGPKGAVLTGLGKQPVAGRNAASVLRREFGWDIPVADLAWWVRGLRAPGAPAVLMFGANGLPATLDQGGWHVQYRDWYAERRPPLPRKVYASRDPYTVRLMIKEWKFVEAPAGQKGHPGPRALPGRLAGAASN